MRGLASGVSQILFFMVPFMIFLMVFSVPLISILAAGKFDPEALQMTADYLGTYALTLPFYAICMYLQKVVSAMRRMGLYALASVIASVVQVVMLLVFTQYFDLNFVAFSSTVFFLLIDVVVFVSLRKNLGPLGLSKVIAAFVKSLLLGLAGGVVGFIVLGVLAFFVGNCATMRSMLYCVLAGLPAVAVTYGLAFIFNMPEAKLINGLIRRFVRR